MTFSFPYARARRLAAALLLAGAAASSFAVPAMDMRLEDLLAMAPDFKQELKLNANQLTLWQQVEGKTRHLLRERQARRERLQGALKQALATPQVELRELADGLDAEALSSAAEEKQLRAWWLTVNDALDEAQRGAVADFLSAQLMRVQDGPGRGGERGRGDERAGRKLGKGGMGGMGGGIGQPGS